MLNAGRRVLTRGVKVLVVPGAQMAGRNIAPASGRSSQSWNFMLAYFLSNRATWVKATARGGADRIRNLARRNRLATLMLRIGHWHRRQKRFSIGMLGIAINVADIAHFDDLP